MLRKLSLIVAAAVSLGAAALVPTAASAHWHGGWGGGGWHHGWHGGYGWHRPFYGPRVFVGGPVYSYGYGGCYVRRVVPTPWGPRWRVVNRCY